MWSMTRKCKQVGHKVHPVKSYRDALLLMRVIPDFPKEGILFQDITPILSDGPAFSAIIREIVSRSSSVDYVAGVEARGFIFAGAIANELGVGFIPIRKKGKLPHDSISRSYGLEYGQAELEIHRDAIPEGSKVLLVDDILATGGTIDAAIELIKELGAVVSDVAFVSAIDELNGYLSFRKNHPSIKLHILSDR
jgi:adenine phosphoribosyltransferase